LGAQEPIPCLVPSTMTQFLTVHSTYNG
jgi:hypothetical protein